MSIRAKTFCRHVGCKNMVDGTRSYCAEHQAEEDARQKRMFSARERRRGSAAKRGYTARWAAYSKYFLSLPENQFCALRLDAGCAIIAQCVDHIDPPDSPSDPRFWAESNHQPACIHCNSVKGDKKIIGRFRFRAGGV